MSASHRQGNESSAREAREGRFALTRIFPLLLPFFLSLLPLIIMHREVREITSLHREQARQVFREQATNAAKRVQTMAKPTFRIEDTAHRIKRTLERKLESQPLPQTDVLRQELSRALTTARKTSSPELKLWAGVLPLGDPNQSPELLQGPGFESEFKTFFVTLFREMFRDAHGLPSSLGDQIWLPRLQSTFGNGVGDDLFSTGNEGKSFIVVFRHQFQVRQWQLVWHLISTRGKPVGIFFLFQPAARTLEDRDFQYLFNHWTAFSGGESLWPAMVSFSFPDKESRILPSPQLQDTPAMHLLKMIAGSQSHQVATGTLDLGSVRLPTLETIDGVESGGWMAMPFSISPLAGHFGVLCGPIPTAPPSPIEHVLSLYHGVFLAFWLLFLALRLGGCHLPSPGVRLELTLWFLGIAATPCVIMWGAGIRLQTDLALNLETSLRSDMVEHLQKLESGIARFNLHSLSACRSIVREPGLHRFFTQLELLSPPDRTAKFEEYFARLVKQLSEQEMAVSAVLVYGPGNGAGYFAPQARLSPASINMIDEFHLAFSLELLRRRFPGFSREEKRLNVPRKPSINAFISHGVGGTNQELFEALDTLSPFRSENKHTIRYHNFVLPDGETDPDRISPYIMVVLWDQAPNFLQYLSEATVQANRLQFTSTPADSAPIRSVALQATPVGFKRISQDTPDADFVSLARKAVFGAFLGTSGNVLQFGFPSSRIPGFFLGACSSLDFIHERISLEKRSLYVSLFLMALFLVSAGHALSLWFGLPIVRMTDGLRRVSQDDLSVQVGEVRNDELGSAGADLDDMIQALKERQTMSRFVAPQVLEVVGHGSFSEACKPQTREVALLVSDVRSFTTMSESHSPAEIFSLINRHLQEMTRIIQHHGGAIDRFIGDAIQAVFYPADGEHMVRRAFRAADEMMMAHHQITRDRVEKGLFPYGIGVGVELGEVVTGVLGDREVRLDFTVMGEPFKHAADLEGASKKGKARLIICSDRAKALAGPGFSFLPLEDPEFPGAWELANSLQDTSAGSLNSLGQAPSREELNKPQALTPAKSDHLSQPSALPEPRYSEVKAEPSPRETSEPDSSPLAIQASPPPTWKLLTLFLLLLFPVFLLLPPLRSLQQARETLLKQATSQDLREDLQLVNRITETKSLASALLRSWSHELQGVIRLHPPSSVKALAFITEKNRLFQQIFPHSAWYYFMDEPFLSQGDRLPMGMNRTIATVLCPFWIPHFTSLFSGERLSTILLAANGTVPGLSPQDIRDLGATMKAFFREIWDHYLQYHFGKALDRSGFGYLKALWRDSLGLLSQVSSGGKERFFLWFPLFNPSTARLLSNPLLLPAGERERQQLVRTGFTGGLLFFIAPEDLGNQLFKPALREILAARGSTIHFYGSSSSDVAFPRQETPESQLSSSAGTQSLSDELLLEKPEPFVLTRTMSEIPRFGFSPTSLVFLLLGVWILLVVLAIMVPVLRGKSPALSLFWQMVGIFFLVLTPALSLALITLEHSSLEHQAQLETHEKNRLKQTLAAIDESQTLYISWGLAGVDSLLRLPVLQNLFVRVDQAEEDDLEFLGGKLLEEIYLQGLHIGLWLDRIFLLGPGGPATCFSNRSDVAPIVSRTLQQITLPSLKRLASVHATKSSMRDQVTDLAIGAGVEEMRLLMSTIFPGKLMAEMANGPRSLSNFVFADEQFLFFKEILWRGGVPRQIFQLQLKNENFDYHNLGAWRDALAELYKSDSFAPRFWSVLKSRPFFIMQSPYLRLKPDDDGTAEVDTIQSLQALDLAELGILAGKAEGPVFRSFGQGQEREWQMAFPGKAMNDSVLSGVVPIGARLLSDYQTVVAPRQNLIFAMLLASFFLALFVARQFLRPIIQLSHHARAIATGDFSVRLAPEGAREFVELAGAFNQMAKGVQEGKLLSRFVSESVRHAAGDDARGQAAERGEFIHVSVIFAGLADFKQILEQQTPQQVVVLLNHFLEAMSQEIRAHGGDIDKFIGEKILAVFHPDRLGGDAAAATAAVKAAEAMRQRMSQLAPELTKPLGIGIVTGPVLAGIMGAPNVRLEYTVIGDTVNLASRLGDLAMKISPTGQVLKTYEGSVGGIVQESRTFDLLKSGPEAQRATHWTRLHLPPIKGKTRSVDAYLHTRS